MPKLSCGCIACCSSDSCSADLDMCPLHAAAPALLKALEEATQYIEQRAAMWNTANARNRGIAERARAAIKLARGGEE